MIGRLVRWWRRSGGDPEVEALIALKGARPRYLGFDPTLRDKRNYERSIAEKVKARSHRIDAGHSQIRRVM